MKPNQLLKDCKVNKPCFHCQKVGITTGVCVRKRFSSNEEGETLAMFTDPLMALETESSLLVSGEQVLMQTALADCEPQGFKEAIYTTLTGLWKQENSHN